MGCRHLEADRGMHRWWCWMRSLVGRNLIFRFQRTEVAKYRNGFNVSLHPDGLTQPPSWKTPQRGLVNGR